MLRWLLRGLPERPVQHLRRPALWCVRSLSLCNMLLAVSSPILYPLGWASVQVSGIQSNQRWTLHNAVSCGARCLDIREVGEHTVTWAL